VQGLRPRLEVGVGGAKVLGWRMERLRLGPAAPYRRTAPYRRKSWLPALAAYLHEGKAGGNGRGRAGGGRRWQGGGEPELQGAGVGIVDELLA